MHRLCGHSQNAFSDYPLRQLLALGLMLSPVQHAEYGSLRKVYQTEQASKRDECNKSDTSERFCMR